MKVADAPPPGWYPDPAGGVRLRWWEGTDWGDRYRSRPTLGGTYVPPPDSVAPVIDQAAAAFDQARQGHRSSHLATADMISEVRQAARAEVDRAAELFGAQARSVTRQIEPIISEYTNRAMKWLKILVILAVVLGIAWVLFQVFAQASFLDWLGERIDNVTDESSSPIFGLPRRA